MSEAQVAPAEAAPAPSATAATEAAPVEAVVEQPAGGDTAPASSEPPKTYTQEDLDRITAKVKKNERYRTKKEIEAYYQGRESVATPPAQQQVPTEEQPPSREQFDSYESFLEAKADFAGRKAFHAERQRYETETKAQAQAREQAERVQTFQGKVNEKYPDLHERLEPIMNVAMPDGVAAELAASQFGPDILNHFAGDHKDFERFVALSPSAALREIGRLEARFESAAPATATTEAAPVTATPAAKKPSSAPAPIKPVGGNAQPIGDDLTRLVDKPEAWALARNKELLKRRTG